MATIKAHQQANGITRYTAIVCIRRQRLTLRLVSVWGTAAGLRSEGPEG
jgi:hypothetical protein